MDVTNWTASVLTEHIRGKICDIWRKKSSPFSEIDESKRIHFNALYDTMSRKFTNIITCIGKHNYNTKNAKTKINAIRKVLIEMENNDCIDPLYKDIMMQLQKIYKELSSEI